MTAQSTCGHTNVSFAPHGTLLTENIIEPVELLEGVPLYDDTGDIVVKLDTTTSEWQQKMCDEREINRKEANQRKQNDMLQ